MSENEVGGPLHVAIRSTGDFRFPDDADLYTDSGDEIGFFAYGATSWDRSEIKAAVNEVVWGLEVRRVTDSHIEVEAGASYESVEILVELGMTFLGGLSLEGAIAIAKARTQRRKASRTADEMRAIPPERFEQEALHAIRERFGATSSQVSVKSVEVSVDGKAVVELDLIDRNERWVVHLQLDDGEIVQYKMKKINNGNRADPGTPS